MNDDMYKLLNECVSLLNGSVDTGQSFVYVTMDRARHSQVLAKIALAKKQIIRDKTKEW
jgi:hypothetical protein